MIMLDPHRQPIAAPGPCGRIVERTHAWLDGELSPMATTALHAHARACPSCARVMYLEARFARVVHARTRIERAPSALRDRVRALLRTIA